MAGDLPTSTSSYLIYYREVPLIKFQISSRLLRITAGSELQLRIPAGSAWNIGLKSASCEMFDRKTCFLGPKTRQLSKTPGNFRKRAGTSQNTWGTSQKHPELSKSTRNFPKTPGTSRELSKTPVELPNTRGTSQKHPGTGRWWVVGG